MTSPEVIKFKFANSDHKKLICNTILKQNDGICHEVFSEQITEQNQALDPNSETLLSDFQHLYVSEVVREPRMYYWTVPRLGSYMAIPLVYKSCLSIESFNQSVFDYQGYKQRCQALDEEKRIWFNQQEALRKEKVENGESFEFEEKEWAEVEDPEIQTELKKFVVCLDTMG